MDQNKANLLLGSQPWAALEKFRLALPVFQAPVLPNFPKLDARWTVPISGQFRLAGAELVEIGSALEKKLSIVTKAMEKFIEHEDRCKRLEQAGWLPHPASPWHLLDNRDLNGAALNEAVEQHYVAQWPAVRAKIEVAITSYLIDDEAKLTFREALLAHEAGLFRCVPRTLFPEIERVSRAVLHHGAMDKIASQPELKKIVGSLCPQDLAREGVSGLRLYNKLVDHMYANMPTPEDVAAIAAEPVPNRHAAVHGYVPYNTLRHSMNALIIAEYLFHAISVQVEMADAISETVAA